MYGLEGGPLRSEELELDPERRWVLQDSFEFFRSLGLEKLDSVGVMGRILSALRVLADFTEKDD